MTSSPIFGRSNEVSQILDYIQGNECTTTLLTGEPGIGKSTVLDCIFAKSKEQESALFVGYYSREESLIAEESLIYPFRVVLEKLIENIVESQNLREQLDIALGKIKNGLIRYAKEQGKKIGLAIIEDIARKVGLEQTIQIGKEIIKEINSENTGILSAQSFIAEHRNEAREAYVSVFKMLAKEFKGRKFLLIFDQFEYVSKASIDFFLNMSKFLMLMSGFHVIVAFKTDEKKNTNTSTKLIFEQLTNVIKKELKGQVINLQGLSVEDIGDWIKSIRNISLPTVPDLKRIRENSSGLPLLLEEWIRSSKDLKDYDKIKRDQLCEQFIKLKDGLEENILKNVYRASILLHPIQDDHILAKYFRMDDLFQLHSFSTKLVEMDIFTVYQNKKIDGLYNNIWFKHEIIQKCFADDLAKSLKKQLHGEAAQFFMELEKSDNPKSYPNGNHRIDRGMKNLWLSISVSAAYHLHESTIDPEESCRRNRMVARELSRAGDLDLAEKCYGNAIEDFQLMKDENRARRDNLSNIEEINCQHELAIDVYITWGRYDEALRIFERTLSFHEQKGNQASVIAVMNNMGEIYFKKGNYDKALELYEQSLDIAKKVGNVSEIPHIINNIALVNHSKGNYDKALELYEQSLDISKRLSDKSSIADILNNMAIVHQDRGNYDKALELYNGCLEYKKITGDQKTINTTLNNIGMIESDKGNYDKALELYEQSLDISKSVGDIAMVGRTPNNIGMIHSDKNELDKALELYEQSLDISKSVGDIAMVGRTLNNMGLIYRNKRNYDKALELYEQSLDISNRVGDPFVTCRTLNNIAEIKYELGDYDKALELYNWCLVIVDGMGDQRGIDYFLSLITKINEHKRSI